MRLKIGNLIPLEPMRWPHAGGRVTVKVLGWLESASLLVVVPQNAAGRVTLQEGEQLLARAFTGKSAFSFRTRVLKVAYQPFQYMHLGFPEKIERVDIRNSYRCRVRLPAMISAAGKADGAAIIVNIGTNGALLESVALVDKDAGPIRIAVSFELYGVPVSLVLSAEVRAAKTEPAAGGFPRHQCGVEFKDLQPNDRLALGSLLWFQMYEHPDHAA